MKVLVTGASGNGGQAVCRLLSAEGYRVRMADVAPPPERFFFDGDSQFVRYTRRAFAGVLPEVERRDAGWFLALFRALGGWRIDVCDAPRRATRGGADDVSLDGSTFEIVSAPEALTAVREAVEAAGFTVDSAELTMRA